MFELAVIAYDGDGVDDWSINYDTPITDDVIGYLSSDAVDELLQKIHVLPPHDLPYTIEHEPKKEN
jgi:hypothetical protein